MTNDFGICWGEPEATLMRHALSTVEPDGQWPIYYTELGCAEGRTFSAVLRCLRELGRKAYGYAVDKAGGWSYTESGFRHNLESFTMGADYQIFLCGGIRFMESCLDETLDVVLIDACHEKDCCKADFLATEPKVRAGGLVVFHDTAEYAQGTDIQPHKGEPIHVRLALQELGLIGSRPGWKLVGEVPGNKERDERGIIVYRKLTVG